jgi:UDP-2,3-diacylglucosamine pyrophosphatase LpxH
MPIHLPPISRRQFLAGALAAGASLSLRSFGQESKGPEPESFRYLFISDIHIGPHYHSEKHGVQPAVEFARAIEHILALKDMPKRAIVTGDYAISWGNHADYKMLHEWISRLSEAGMSCRFAMGNHDSRRPFMDEFPHAKELADPRAKSLGKYVYVYETALANWFFLDSLHEDDRNLGVLGEPQLKWLADALDARRDKPALVVGHHNPSLRSNLRDTAAFYEVITPRKQVKAYIYGHTHCWGLNKHEGIHLVNVPTVSAWKDAEQPRGFLTADLHPNRMAVTLHTVGHKETKDHELAWR